MHSDGERLARQVQVRLRAVTVVANLVGAVVVFALLLWVVPTPVVAADVGLPNLIGVPAYIAMALAVGAVTRRHTSSGSRPGATDDASKLDWSRMWRSGSSLRTSSPITPQPAACRRRPLP